MNQSAQKAAQLEERTVLFAEAVIDFCKSVPQTEVSKPLIRQLIRSATSIGANYREANNASSRKDFRNKIYICKKEAQETVYWLRLIKKCTEREHEDLLRSLSDEAQQFVLIFQRVVMTINSNEN